MEILPEIAFAFKILVVSDDSVEPLLNSSLLLPSVSLLLKIFLSVGIEESGVLFAATAAAAVAAAVAVAVAVADSLVGFFVAAFACKLLVLIAL